MKFYYPTKVKRENEELFHAVFPDLETCEATASSLEDVLERATDAARNWIEAELEEDEPYLPPATDPVDMLCGPDESVHMILINIKAWDGWDE